VSKHATVELVAWVCFLGSPPELLHYLTTKIRFFLVHHDLLYVSAVCVVRKSVKESVLDQCGCIRLRHECQDSAAQLFRFWVQKVQTIHTLQLLKTGISTWVLPYYSYSHGNLLSSLMSYIGCCGYPYRKLSHTPNSYAGMCSTGLRHINFQNNWLIILMGHRTRLNRCTISVINKVSFGLLEERNIRYLGTTLEICYSWPETDVISQTRNKSEEDER